METVDGDSFPEIRSLEDLLSIPHFVAPLAIDAHPLLDLIKPYHFAKMHECGIAACRTKHLHGYLAITSDGFLTNIGHCCADKYFPEFKLKLNALKYRRSMTENERAHLKIVEERFPLYEQELATLQDGPHNILWAHRCHRVTVKYAPSGLLLHREGMSRGDFNLYRMRTISRDDRWLAEMLGGKDRITAEAKRVATMRGVSAFWASGFPYAVETRMRLSRARTENFRKLKLEVQRTRLMELAQVPTLLSDSRQLLQQARLCFTPGNLKLLYKVADGDLDKAQIASYMQKIADVEINPQQEAS